MKIKLIALAIITLLAQSICAQNIFKAIVKDGDTKEILVGVNAVLNKTANGASSDENGIITISNIPDGKQHITFSYLGYESETKSYTFPLSSSAPVEIFLEQDDEMLEEVTISSTRGTRTIQNIPTRVEFISSEELGEKREHETGRHSYVTKRKHRYYHPANFCHIRKCINPHTRIGWQIYTNIKKMDSPFLLVQRADWDYCKRHLLTKQSEIIKAVKLQLYMAVEQ